MNVSAVFRNPFLPGWDISMSGTYPWVEYIIYISSEANVIQWKIGSTALDGLEVANASLFQRSSSGIFFFYLFGVASIV